MPKKRSKSSPKNLKYRIVSKDRNSNWWLVMRQFMNQTFDTIQIEARNVSVFCAAVTSEGEIVGALAWKKLRDRAYISCGTIVYPKRYRKGGIGIRMWSTLISHVKPKRMIVTTVSRGGKALVEKLKKKHPRLDIVHRLS